MVLDYPVMLTLMGLLVLFGITSHKLHRWQGGIILGVYLVYLAIMFLYFA